MKKILSLVLVAVMLMSMTVTAFAAGEQSGTSKVNAVVPEPVPEYTIHIPADMTLEYGNGARQLVGEIFVTNVQNVPDGDLIWVNMKGTPLKSTEGNEIPVVFEWRRDYDEEYKNPDKSSPTLYSMSREYLTAYLYATVTEADWKAAKPGTYTSTITYEFLLPTV